MEGPSPELLAWQAEGKAAALVAEALGPFFTQERAKLDATIYAAVSGGTLTGELAIQFCAQIAEQERLVRSLEVKIHRGVKAGEALRSAMSREPGAHPEVVPPSRLAGSPMRHPGAARRGPRTP